MELDPEVELLASNKRYVLGDAPEFYGVWEKAGVGSQPMARFAKTDEGLEAAVEHFERLSRIARWRGDPVGVPLLILMAGGIVVWTVVGAIRTIKGNGVAFFPNSDSTFLENLAITEVIAYRIWIGALALLIALGLVRYVRRSSEG